MRFVPQALIALAGCALAATVAHAGKVTRMADGSLACVEGGAMVSGAGGWSTSSPATVGNDCNKALKVKPEPGMVVVQGRLKANSATGMKAGTGPAAMPAPATDRPH